MKLRVHQLAAIVTILFASSSFAQTSNPEIEPNSQKSEATVANDSGLGMIAGDKITGTTTGSTTTLGSTVLSSVDMFRVQTRATVLGIYKHRLTLTTTGTQGHAGTLRGVTQTGTFGTAGTGGTRTTIDTRVQSNSSPTRFNSWYGFGKGEEQYYRVSGGPSTTAPYAATLATTTVTPILVPNTFESANPITITTVGQTTVDTTILIFDANYDAIPGGSNDDAGGTLQSRLVRTLAPGDYYLAIGLFSSSWSLASPADEEVPPDLLEFPGSLQVPSAFTGVLDFDFQIAASNGVETVLNTKPVGLGFDATWHKFTVQAGAPLIAPDNDLCANATPVGGNGAFVGTCSGSANDGTSTCDAASRDVWYSYTNPSSCFAVALSVDTCTTTYDTALAVYSMCGGGGELACSDDCVGPLPCAANTSCVSGINVNPLQTVWIRIADKTGTGGNFTVHLFATMAPPNDLCGTPRVLPSPGLYCINNQFGTTGIEGQANALCNFSGGTAIQRDLWYTYTATANGTATVTTCGLIAGGPSEDSKIAIYAGSGCPAAPAIACVDDAACPGFSPFNSTVTFAVTCGTVYTLQIGMYGGTGLSMSGQFRLTEAGTSCNTVFTPYCTDTDGTFCPCNNQGGPGRGCENTASTGGGLLTSTGVADTSSDTLVLSGSFLVPFGPGLYYQGSVPVTPGVAFGNGLRCAGGATPRIEIRVDNGLGGDVTAGDGITQTTVSVSAFGGVVAPATHYYQLWYRDTGNVGTCTPGAGFNFTNAISLPWVP